MEFRLLGPVELWADDQYIDVGPAKTQLLLAVLLMAAGRVVPFDTLVYRVWDERAPAKASLSVQSIASRLRGRLAEAGAPSNVLEHVQPNGYRLRVTAEQVDFRLFDRTVASAHAAVQRGDHIQALEMLREAERLVRGEPLAGLPGPWAETARVTLQERSHAATLTRISLQLEREDPRPVISELRELAGHSRLDQTVVGLLMRALYAVGRTAEALDEYELVRLRLRDQLGIDPHRPLKDLYLQILRGESIARPARRSAPRAETASNLDSLEPEPAGFVGRRADIELVEHEIEVRLAAGKSALVLIDGMPGVGKSTFALLLAHRLRARAGDIALELPLHGYDPAQPPSKPDAALRLLLIALGTDPQQVQRIAGVDHAITLWRRRTAGQRVVLFLDDAESVDQVRPLLPNGAGNVVFVTSRPHLDGLPDAIQHTLRPMTVPDAAELFTRAAKTTIAAEQSDTLMAILNACGNLPFALAVTGGYLATRSSWSLGDLSGRLARMLVTQESDALATRLNAAFETSYRDLGELPKRTLRRLGLHPAEYLGLGAAAALAGLDRTTAELALDTLVDHNLLSEPKRHRYRLHTAVHNFAAAVLARDESVEDRTTAEDRLIRFTLCAVDAATAAFHPHRHVNLVSIEAVSDPTHLEILTDAREAGAWLDDEQESLRALAMRWYAKGRQQEAAGLTHMLAMYFDRRGLWKESAPLCAAALTTWREARDACGVAYALTDLATLSWRLDELNRARAYADEALASWRRLDDVAGQADALLQLGRAYQYAHRMAPAVRAYRQSAELCAQPNDAHGQAVARYHLGTALAEHGDYDQGATETETALELARQTEDAAVERNCLNNLGEMLHYYRGAVREAVAYYQEALVIAERLGDSRNIAIAAFNLGQANIELECYERARPLLDEALRRFRQLGRRQNEIAALLAMARLNDVTDQTDVAEALMQEAGAAATELGGPATFAVFNLAVGDRHRRYGNVQDAVNAYRQTLQHAHVAKMPLEQAVAHRVLGDCLKLQGQVDSAKEHWREALSFYEPLGAVYAGQLRALLATAG